MRGDLPLVSIITPAHNAEKFIAKTLKSVEGQDYQNLEHIVLDDGSTDNTSSILKQYQKNYNLRWFSKRNEGQTVTVNKGFDMAQGDLVIWLNADDVLFNKQVTTSIVRKFESDPSIGVVYGHTAILDENSRIIKIQFSIPWFNLGTLRRAHFAPGIFYRRNVALKYKLDSTFNYAMDYEQTLKMCNDRIRFAFLNKILIGYRRHKATKSMSQRPFLNAETKRLRKKYGEKFGVSYYFSKCLDDSYLLFFKLCGIKTVVNLYMQPEASQLAFDVKFDSLPKLVLRQVLPYVS